MKKDREKCLREIRLRQMVTFAFIRARCSKNKCVALQMLFGKFCTLNHSDVVGIMDESAVHEIFKREITGNGIVYRLTGKFKYAEFDEVNKFMNERLNKKVEKK